MGGDSAGVDHYNICPMAEPKVFVNGAFAIGYTTSFRMGQLLRYRFKPPHREEGKDVMAYMVCDWLDAVRDLFKQSGFSQKSNEKESGGTFLVGYAGRLFRVEDYYSIIETANGYDACGCGEELARGALHAASQAPAPDRVAIALRAAAHHSAGVCEPFHFVAL